MQRGMMKKINKKDRDIETKHISPFFSYVQTEGSYEQLFIHVLPVLTTSTDQGLGRCSHAKVGLMCSQEPRSGTRLFSGPQPQCLTSSSSSSSCIFLSLLCLFVAPHTPDVLQLQTVTVHLHNFLP